MDPTPPPTPSFSPYRKWGIGLHVCFLTLVVLSVVVMVNYLSGDHFARFHLKARGRTQLSPRTLRFLNSVTNQVKVTVYFDKSDSMYSLVADLLNEYKLANPKITLQTVDFLRDAGAALKLKEKYPFLAAPNAKNFVIFDCDGKTRAVEGNALAQYVLEQVPNEKEQEFRRKPVLFEGERAFTASLIAVTNPKPLKAYFLQDDGEHPIDSGDERVGYLKFASVLQQNYIQPQKLSLLGTNPVPADCNLLVIAGPTTPLPSVVLDKVEQYLSQGGRLLALFNFASARKPTGLEAILAKWGVAVGPDVIKDPENTTQRDGTDLIVGRFGKHAIVSPLLLLRLHLIMPRPIGKLPSSAQTAEAPRIEELAFSGPKSVIPDKPGLAPQAFPVIVAVEKGAIKGMITERGTTRMVVAGDSFFLANHQIDSTANRDFASYVANWLLDRTQLLEGLDSRPVAEYRLALTKTQQQSAEWILLGAMPGGVLVLGSLVWFRRRR